MTVFQVATLALAGLDHLAIWMPWVALVLSATTLATAFGMQRRHLRNATHVLETQRIELDKIATQQRNQAASLSSQRRTVGKLVGKMSRWKLRVNVAVDEADVEDDLRKVDKRMQRFLDLIIRWQRATGLKLNGAASEDRRTIDKLTELDRRGDNAETTELAFGEAARPLARYVVTASRRSGQAFEEEELEKVVEELADLAGLKLLRPQLGQRYDSKQHEFASKVAAHANRRETIARVEEWGLLDRTGRVTKKARVQLYD